MTDNNRTTDVLQKLTQGIEQLTTSERWTEWLAMQSQFRSYSFNNTLLILLQRPDATHVAGYNAWRKLDRFVCKGEKGIWILAPMVYKSKDSADGNPDAAERVIRGFKPVAVFDVAQTDGKELPEVCTRLQGDDITGTYANLLAVAGGLGFTVETAEDLGGANGDCTHGSRRIRILSTNSPVQQLKTLAHELGHAILHEHLDDRAVAELEAESVAFVVCASLGIETGDYSFGYVASWAGGGDDAIAAIKASGGRIQSAAQCILTSLDSGDVESAA